MSSHEHNDPRYYANRSSLHDSGIDDVSALSSKPTPTSPLAQSFKMSGGGDQHPLQDSIVVGRRKSVATDPDEPTGSHLHRSASAASHRSHRSTMSATSAASGVSRSNTLRKQKSMSRKSSLKRSSSKRSVRAGAIGGVTYNDTSGEDMRSIFYTPVPTSGSPTDILSARFQGWRKVLKDLIIYIKELQTANEAKAKIAEKVSKTISGMPVPLGYKQEGGLGEATAIFKLHHKQSIAEAVKAREVYNDVVSQLSSLRGDLNQKIKEIKSLSGDFKNNIEKEKDNTKKILGTFQESLAAVDTEAKAMVGKDDPYLVRLAVERQVERQTDEENYLHRAYLNIEGSGRELESIVVGEIQKAYKAIATMLKKEVDDTSSTVEKLQHGPIALAKDNEWEDFIRRDSHFISPDTPLRKAQDLEYPGKFHPASTEVRAGMLERKSKYLKSYTPGWFVLSPTHLHEFKSADAVYTQAPIVSLYLHDQKLGAHSQPDSNSHKFILKGRQTGSMHRGHSWVFRAETYDTMLAWFDDIKVLTETTGEERNAFVRGHTRSLSRSSARSVSSFDDDEADEIPFNSKQTSIMGAGEPALGQEPRLQRPVGGRFPSDMQLRRDGMVRGLTPSSDGSDVNQDIHTAEGFVTEDTNKPMATASHMNGEKSLVGATRPGPAFETPAPITTDPPVPQQAEYATATATPLRSVADLGVMETSTQGASTPTPVVTGMNDKTFIATELPVSVSKTQPEELAAVESNAWLHSSDPLAAGTSFQSQSPIVNDGSKPNMRRNDTDNFISNHHVPGEYPKGAKA